MSDEIHAVAEYVEQEPDNGLRCNVCNGESEHPAVGVAGSALGAVSFAYCRTCLRNNAEPYRGLRLMVLWDCGGLGNCAEWVRSLRTWHEGRYISVAELPPLTDDERAELEAEEELYNQTQPWSCDDD